MLDKAGFHYDPAQPSDLEQILQHAPLNDPQELQRAEDAIFRLQDQHLSKYSAFDPRMLLPVPRFILLIDQTRGDGAVRASGGGQIDFDAMLAHAKAHFPAHKIIIRTHPETRFNCAKVIFLRGIAIAHRSCFSIAQLRPGISWNAPKQCIVFCHS